MVTKTRPSPAEDACVAAVDMEQPEAGWLPAPVAGPVGVAKGSSIERAVTDHRWLVRTIMGVGEEERATAGHAPAIAMAMTDVTTTSPRRILFRSPWRPPSPSRSTELRHVQMYRNPLHQRVSVHLATHTPSSVTPESDQC